MVRNQWVGLHGLDRRGSLPLSEASSQWAGHCRSNQPSVARAFSHQKWLVVSELPVMDSVDLIEIAADGRGQPPVGGA